MTVVPRQYEDERRECSDGSAASERTRKGVLTVVPHQKIREESVLTVVPHQYEDERRECSDGSVCISIRTRRECSDGSAASV